MKGVWKRGHHNDYIKRIQEYDEKKICAHKFDNWDEIDQFCERQFTKIHTKTNNLNRPISIFKILINSYQPFQTESTKPKCFHWWILSNI